MSRQGTPCGGWTPIPSSQEWRRPAPLAPAPSHERGQDADLVEAHLRLVRLAHHRLLHPHAQLAGERRARLPRGRPLLGGREESGGRLSPVELAVAEARVDRHGVRLVGRLRVRLRSGGRVRSLDHLQHGARREEHLLLAGKLREERDVGAVVEARVRLARRAEAPQHVGARLVHVMHWRGAVARGGHERGVGGTDHAELAPHPEGVRQLAAHATVQRRARLLGQRDGGELADRAAEVRHRGRVRCLRVRRKHAAETARSVGRHAADRAEKVVDNLVRRAGVQPHREHLLAREKRVGLARHWRVWVGCLQLHAPLCNVVVDSIAKLLQGHATVVLVTRPGRLVCRRDGWSVDILPLLA
mmetsp:Transcript_31374/g.103507  ORF Transcript_31374/g.103507 Transcript_31374/m.103507 type:complete len:358 (+) Transcript_31374:191-1264(+)